MNTSEDSVSDLESDAEEGEVGLEVERPLTADETRRLQREWRARYKGRSGLGSDGSDGDIDREVRYTDHEYEDDTSDGEDDQINTRVPFLPGSGGRQRQRRRSSDDSTSSDYTTSSIESSSDESELRDLDEKFNRDNPFTVPKIIVQPNSPVPPTSVSKPTTKPIQPDPKYISQSVPLGPSAYGSALYQPSLSSMMKYQHKTPALPSQPPQQTNSQYRTLSGVLSNNLKKNWVTPSAPASQTQRKVDQAEIDARLKSLMDRLSSQQSLLKPAEKPSAQMQHYMQSTATPSLRKLSDSKPFSPYKPSITSPQTSANTEVKEAEVIVEENGVSLTVPELPSVSNGNGENDTEDSETDSTADTGSVTTEVDEIENNVELQVPEIKINLAESEDPLETSGEKCDKTCDTISGTEVTAKDCTEEQSKENGEIDEAKPRKLPVRRPSLLKTVVNIKHDQPVTVVNYSETVNDETPTKSDNNGTDLEDSFKTPSTDVDIFKENGESFVSAMDTSSSVAEDSIVAENNLKNGENIECFNKNILTGEDEGFTVDNEKTGNEEDECGNLVFVDHNGAPMQEGENETSTDVITDPEVTEAQKSKFMDMYKLTDSREKKEKLGQYTQHQSNMIHDLIIGKTKQRRTRQPRVIATTSSVPAIPPQEHAETEQKSLETFDDFQMIDDDDGVGGKARDKSITRPMRENSMSRSIRESSMSRSLREGSPKVSLPPTPITNPEKFGIGVSRQNQSKRQNKGSMSSLLSPTESVTSNDIDYHLDGIQSDVSTPASPNKSSASPSHKKSKGFMAAVAGIFRTASPSPVTSPVHVKKDESGQSAKMGRWSRRDGSKNKEGDLVTRTASLSLQASHPSTPPVPLSRKVKLGSQPPQASEDSFSDDDDGTDVKDKSLSSIVKETSRTGLPKQILERLEKRMTKHGKKFAKQAGSLRIRRAQEIHRELEEVEVECVNVEEKGVGLEQELRKDAENNDIELMQQWFGLLREKNKLVRREQELMVEAKQLELEDQAEKLESELATGPGGSREGDILDNLVKNADQRELLSSMLARDKERYRQEDKEIEMKMAEQGIRLS